MHTVNVKSWDNMGFQSGDVTDGPLCYDTVPPTITSAPKVDFQNHVGPIGSTVPVTVKWKGTDATSGVSFYTLYESKDAHAFSEVAVTAAGPCGEFAPGHTYQYEVTATDNAGNLSPAKAAKRTRSRWLQETASAVKYSTG